MELMIQLITIFATATIMNGVEIGLPIIFAKKPKEHENANSVEKDALLAPSSKINDE